ncbi:chromate efflux transporter [Geoalkalibacter halelectricus]|uniref:Chromate efflux transporter n=1 Tax=Geoalkalibacter halelectricus TaxID=2847045 RepID=A0ABY5ZKF1_9BACT|nr:chromate efflux transporter [Geoalkalibacter halelectricus]MDO3380265.1 chromate efflux transporter [Geoalkalibacter halelectricus]UWZ79533.1 chromate efflux transporter [Geoalkalibacter halelectricus]
MTNKEQFSIGLIFLVFLKLGLTSFGGPVAHLGFFREEFVQRRRWLSEESYADLVALCQFLPGPASSQVGYAIGLRQGGTLGGLAAWLGFTMPSAAALIAFAYGVASMGDVQNAGWLQGLKVAAVAVVAKAVWGMAVQLCPDRPRATVALLAAIVALAWPTSITQVLIILAGGALGWVLYREAAGPVAVDLGAPSFSRRKGAIFLSAFFLLLFGLPVLVAWAPVIPLQVFESFYRSGSLVFGGGHVVLPLLQAEVVPPGWVGGDSFLAGYGAAQAVPGPLFTFAAYLGAAMAFGPGGWIGGLWALVAIFLPSVLLVQGALPFWETLRRIPTAQAALRGTNAAVVGILLAAMYDPVWTKGIHGPADVIVGLAAFGLLHFWKTPPWLVVILASLVGLVYLG